MKKSVFYKLTPIWTRFHSICISRSSLRWKSYGIDLVTFYVNDISVPEDDPAVKQLKEALAKRAEMNIIGYSYQQERSFDTMEGAATNPSSTAAPIMGAGLGVGMGFGMGQSVGGGFGAMAQEINLNAPKENTHECPKCHAVVPTAQRFCGNCGFDFEKSNPSVDQEQKPQCSSCGAEITPDIKFCPECGRKINPCQNCGTDLPDNAQSCPKCGYEAPVLCPGCGAEISSKAKFCPECGQVLVKHCPKCNAAVDGSPKFCPECGEKL